MTHHYQPRGSKQCGQHCVAMIAGITPAESIDIFKHSSSTRTAQVKAALKELGIDTAPRYKRYVFKKSLPKFCIIRMLWLHGKGSHVAVYKDGYIYCSSMGVYRYSKQYFIDAGCRPVSFLKIIQ